ncbi:hypothetical protein [Bradyrhizobium ivorense]|nr:hypothetical protein [Bradyrhizobium ivorense]
MKLLRSGVDFLTIQAWLGHAQVATTGVSGDRSARFRPNDTILQLLANI